MSESDFTRSMTADEFEAVCDELRKPLERIREIIEENDVHVIFASNVLGICDLLESTINSEWYKPKR